MKYEVKFGVAVASVEATNIVEAIDLACSQEKLPLSGCTSVKEVTVRYGRKTIDVWEFFDQENNPVGTFYSKAAADKFSAECGNCVYVTKKRSKT